MRYLMLATIWIGCLGTLGRLVSGEEGAPHTTLAPVVALPPHGEDYTVDSLRQYFTRLSGQFGPTYRDIPLDVKADFFEWELWRYHKTPYHQVYNRVLLPTAVGAFPGWMPGSDSSTWNGALLGALSYKYAVTHDPVTLARIGELVRGMHFFFEVTGVRGLPARSVTLETGLVQPDQKLNYVAPDGKRYVYRSEAAKGTVNQIVGGYLTLLLYVGAALPAETWQLARADLDSVAMHVVDHDYHLTEADGKRTPYGDLTPLIGSRGVPFNAQVAYLIVGAGHYYPPDDPAEKQRIDEAYRRVRLKHHAYYEEPWGALIVPQRVGGSTFVKGMNDRSHVTYAAFLGLMLEIEHARRGGHPFDRNLVYQLGNTMVHSMDYLADKHNSLCNFMWSALIADGQVFERMVPRNRDAVKARAELALVDGVEQLRRFKLDRFCAAGRELPTAGAVYNDAQAPDDYLWKANPDHIFQPTEPVTNSYQCAIDYLHAYWMFRYYRLDAHPSVVQYHQPVIRPTPRLVSAPPR